MSWCGTLFPTNGHAQEAEMSLAEYEDFVFGAGTSAGPAKPTIRVSLVWNRSASCFVKRCPATIGAESRQANKRTTPRARIPNSTRNP